MNIPGEWFLLYQPKYKTPSVFDLHERGLFAFRPEVSKDRGVRLLVNKELKVKIQYMLLTEGNFSDNTGKRYPFKNNHAFIDLTEDMKLMEGGFSDVEPDAGLRDEIIKVQREWYESYVPLEADGNINKLELDKKLNASINERRKEIGQELVRKNTQWIQSALPRKLFNFHRGLYQRVSDRLCDDYLKRGGEDNEKGLIKKICLFNRIYDSDGPDYLLKPNGGLWKDEDEVWECWSAFAGSESEAIRICSNMDAVFRPLVRE